MTKRYYKLNIEVNLWVQFNICEIQNDTFTKNITNKK